MISPHGETLRTFAEIDAEARTLAAALPGNGAPVILQTGNHPAFPAALLACWMAGHPVVLADAGLSLPVLREIEEGTAGRFSAENGEAVWTPRPEGRPACKPEADLFKLTSGTTSRPALLPFTADQLLADGENICLTMGLGSHDRNLGVIAFTHSYGFSNLMTPLLARGIPLVVANDPIPRALQSALEESAATVLPAVPAMFRGLLTAGHLPETLRLCVSAGAPLDTQLARRFHEKFQRKIHSFYGASECGGICYDASDDPGVPAGFVGEPLRGVRVEPVTPDAPHRIRVTSAAVGLSAEFFEPADLLERSPAGWRLVGRDSDLINVGGKKVSPLHVEEILLTAPGVREAVVFGAVRQPGQDEVVCAAVVAEGPTESVAIRQHCAPLLSRWEVPRDIFFLPAIPVNARGKVSRRELAALLVHRGV